MSASLAEPVIAAPSPAGRAKRGGVPVIHAEPPALDPALGGDAALRRIGLAGLDHLSRNEAAALAGMPGGIHQMRVAARRLRAMMSGFAERLPEDQRHWAAEELCWLADALARARNLDVFETALLRPVQRASDDPLAFEPLRRAAERQRRAAHRLVIEAIRSDRYASLIAHLLAWFETCGWRRLDPGIPEPPVGEVAGKILRRRWRAAKKRGKEFAEQAPEQRHRLRIALKKLRYTAEATASLYPPDVVAPLTARLKRLQDELGHLNDVRVGHEILVALASDDGPNRAIAEAGGRMLDWHERRLIDREPKLREHLRELFEAQPFWHG
jgi:CHAD domain-containing protein